MLSPLLLTLKFIVYYKIILYLKIFVIIYFRVYIISFNIYCICIRFCCCSFALSCLTLCGPVDCSTPGFPVLHHFPEFAQTHGHWVGDSVSMMPVTQWHRITGCIKFDRHITRNFQTTLYATSIFWLLLMSFYNIVQWLAFLTVLDPSLHQLENCSSVIFKEYNAGDSFWALHSWQCLFFLCLAMYFVASWLTVIFSLQTL